MFSKVMNPESSLRLSPLWFAAIVFLSPNVFGLVRQVRVPEGGISPDVAVGSTGTVYLVFGKAGNAYFASSKDDGRSFSPPLRLNREAGTVLAGHERGPKIALGKNETIHVIWMDARSEQLDYTRSTSRGEKFSTARNLLDANTHLDGATVSADARGNVRVFWLDGRLPQDPANPFSLPIFTTSSRDNGETFSADLPLASRQPLRACSCCALTSVAIAPSLFELVYRGAYHNIRDPFVAALSPEAEAKAVWNNKIENQNWELEGCPMSGPFLGQAYSENGLWAAWMSDGEVYYAKSLDRGETFPWVRSPEAARRAPRNHPIVLVNPQGQIFLAWEEGGRILWQIADASGKVVNSGDRGKLPENSKANAFVDRHGDFCPVF